MGIAGNSGTPWTEWEIDLTVACYFEMLNNELSGQQYRKIDYNRRLQEQLANRSKGAIEYKFRNISAVLSILGYPRINGYLPAFNIQGALVGGVERYMELEPLDPLIDNLVQSRANQTERNIPVVVPWPNAPEIIPIQPVPDVVGHSPKHHSMLRHLLKKHDRVARDIQLRELGDLGEAMVLNSEIKHLRVLGRNDLAKKVRWVAKLDGDSAGFDIRSFNQEGEERYLEVKTTVGGDRTPFFISENERNFSEQNPGKSRIYRLYNFLRNPAAFKVKPPLEETFYLSPTNYRASLR